MDAVERMLIEHACARLVVRYGVLFDARDYEGWIKLFTPDARWGLSSGKVVEGHSGLRAFVVAMPQPVPTYRHIANNICIDVVDENNATGIVYGTTMHADPMADGSPGQLSLLDSVVEYHDRYVRQDGQWRIAERRAVAILKAG